MGRIVTAVVALAAAGGLLCTPVARASLGKSLDFAFEMAEAGNWNEARYRWERALDEKPGNARYLNNLAVALEAVGEVDDALAMYREAHGAAPKDPRIAENARNAMRFWADVEGRELDPDTLPKGEAVPRKRKVGKKAERVPVSLPIPARLDVGERERTLVASFQTREDEILDTNREFVRFVRSELQRRSPLEVLDVVPPPAIPEQPLEVLVQNASFWQFLGRRHDAEIIVSGAVSYDRRDASGFRDVDVVSRLTGQKVREQRFVEQEEFLFEVDLLFMDGSTGELLYRDNVRRGVRFEGLGNDPITAFFEIGDALSKEIRAVVNPRERVESRIVYRR